MVGMSARPHPPQARRSAWTPHLWVLVVPIGFVAVSYVLWFGFLWLFRFPDWFAALWHR
jgi:hypothetical protein